MKTTVVIVPWKEGIHLRRAGSIAQLAARDYAAGRRDDLWKLLPLYSRRSAAEEKLEK